MCLWSEKAIFGVEGNMCCFTWFFRQFYHLLELPNSLFSIVRLLQAKDWEGQTCVETQKIRLYSTFPHLSHLMYGAWHVQGWQNPPLLQIGSWGPSLCPMRNVAVQLCVPPPKVLLPRVSAVIKTFGPLKEPEHHYSTNGPAKSPKTFWRMCSCI